MRSLIEPRVRNFSSWNLSRLDLQNCDDEECLEALDEEIFTSIFRQHDELAFSAVYNELDLLRNNYGYFGFHKGFGELLSNILQAEHDCKDLELAKNYLFSERTIRMHLSGVSDKKLNQTIDNLFY